MSTQEARVSERMAFRGLRVCVAVLGVPLCSALVVLFVAMRDYAALHRAASAGDVGQVEQILDRHPERLDRRIKGGMTPLHEAAWERHADVIAALIRRGADVNAKWDSVATGDGQWNALHIASTTGCVRVAEVLLSGGTDINWKSLAGETPLDVAIRNDKWELAHLLRSHGGVSGKNR